MTGACVDGRRRRPRNDDRASPNRATACRTTSFAKHATDVCEGGAFLLAKRSLFAASYPSASLTRSLSRALRPRGRTQCRDPFPAVRDAAQPPQRREWRDALPRAAHDLHAPHRPVVAALPAARFRRRRRRRRHVRPRRNRRGARGLSHSLARGSHAGREGRSRGVGSSRGTVGRDRGGGRGGERFEGGAGGPEPTRPPSSRLVRVPRSSSGTAISVFFIRPSQHIFVRRPGEPRAGLAQ